MDYDFRNKPASSPHMYPTTSSFPAPERGQSLYPTIGQHHPAPNPAVSRQGPSPWLGIRIAAKPEYRMSPPPYLVPQIRDIPRSNFQLDFELERKILAAVENGSHNLSKLGLENLSPKVAESTHSPGTAADPVASKYVALGVNQEVLALAIANYGDNPTKIEEFAKGYKLLKEMGFSQNKVAESLLMFDNDTDKALAHCLSGSS